MEKVTIMKRTIFITGATGNIGGKIACEILRDDPAAKLILLVRGRNSLEAEKRLLKTFGNLYSDMGMAEFTDRIEVLCGDITSPNLGLSESCLGKLESEITHIIHAAAGTKFDQPFETARLTNIEGTKNITSLARRLYNHGRLRQLAYISTAYVCDRSRDMIYEDQIPVNPQFSNNYEKSKWEAEQHVRSLMPQLPIAIFRPSIVIGDSATGRLNNFNVIYAPLRFICRGTLPVLPCSSASILDIVPVDYVAAAICHIMFKTHDAHGKIYHITAGIDNQPTVGEIVSQTVEYINHAHGTAPIRRPRYVKNSIFHWVSRFLPRKLKKIINVIMIFEPYVLNNLRFDCTNTAAALAGSGIYPPKPSQYLGNILGYWLKATHAVRIRKAA
ncbi:MAG: hypothetical protein CVT49_07730 [candidate division Zixibacteria bacterium HGW-Zixibacteria-1]|nr:MAG: hypothetical protein CVT49_07730 [candidate division Zixibacteria bacterium HGW-Zixibacteria-1]